ncbi:STAS domain-containing protein [Niveibacterium sp. SC-1]|uniref:STAS domain-containing protein n=1 Tax=Niveibacterium sp. SC-1 TaxID=3135646 RepID=UPI00311F2E2B
MVIPFFRKGADDPAQPQSKAAAKKPVGDPHTSTLDFTQGDARALAAAADRIHVGELSDNEHPAVEEAAILFANASDDAAVATLEAALDQGADGNEMLWNMLFDLYRLANRKEAFDQRGVAYATQFNRSPPVWSGAQTAKPAPRDATPSVSLTGGLNAQAGGQLEQISKIAARAGKLKIDLVRVRSTDEAGCELLVNFLRHLRASKVKVFISNARNMLPMVESHAQAGRREGQAIWLMTLELLQALGEQDRFDEVALDYAITFEESPPSYEPPPVAPAAISGKTAPAAAATGGLELVPIESEQNSFAFEGDLTSAQGEPLRKLAKFAADRNTVDVDASRLNRMDFVSAGNLFNLLTQFQTQGKATVIREVNAMVGALLRVMGIHHVAQVELRRI